MRSRSCVGAPLDPEYYDVRGRFNAYSELCRSSVGPRGYKKRAVGEQVGFVLKLIGELLFSMVPTQREAASALRRMMISSLRNEVEMQLIDSLEQ